MNGLALGGLVSLAQTPAHQSVKPLEVALITAPEPAPMAAEPAPEAAKPPEPLPVAPTPPPPPKPKPKPPKREPKPEKVVEPTPALTPEPVPVAIAPAATERSSNTISAEAAEPSAPVASKIADTPVAAAAADPGPVHEPPRADASWSGNVPPPYPALARRLGEQGEVRLDIQISPEGTVMDIKLKRSSGSSLLDQTAMDTVRKWRFKPATVGGQAVAEWYYNWRWVFKLEG
ncbi:MAG: energy transducer TonB [Burkholderiaceae bacterium]